MTYLNAAFILARIALIAAMLPLAIGWRTPLLTTWRPLALAALLIASAIVIAIDIWTLRRVWWRSILLRLMSVVSLILAIFVFGVTAAIELQFQSMRRAVLAADSQQLEKLGAHVVIGYRKSSELHALLERRAVGGVFLSALNVEGKTPDEIRDAIDALQATRRAQGLAALWIATDQEGGPVSRMSPPLTRMPPLAEIVAIHRDAAERLIAVRQYATRQGRELASLGVNLNFAPVVDLNYGVVNPEDKTSRISTRAISNDPAVVTQVADLYCETLMLTGVHCTLKHFPGLGRVYEDTHKLTADLAAPAQELEATDWLPFRHLKENGSAFTMLGDARLTAIDAERPASFSNAVVKGLLREAWGHRGILITDDFSMGAVTLSHEGPAGGAIAALNAGVDLILVSYDPDQYFPIMYALLRADSDGRLDPARLAESAARLRRVSVRENSAKLLGK
ncbi:MAG: glycoside hydrolase family 3 N-terminal domain-containing protein [Alphaproteobacteria bacterium]